MNVKGVIKVVVLIVVLLALAPVVLNLLPEALTLDSARAGFEKAGYTVHEFSPAASPQLEAVEQVNCTLSAPGVSPDDGPIHATLYRFDNEGKLKKQYEYNKPDSGQGMAQAFVQTSGLGQTRQPTPVAVGANGMWLIVVSGADKQAVRAVAHTFETL